MKQVRGAGAWKNTAWKNTPVAYVFRLCASSKAATKDQRAHQDGDHGEAPVLDLLDLQLLEDFRVVGEAQRVEGAARVQVVQAVEDVALELADAGRVAGRAAAIFPAEGHRSASAVRPRAAGELRQA